MRDLRLPVSTAEYATMMLVRVVAPRFVAGFVVENDRCVESAPILRRTLLGKTSDQIRAICAAHGWRASVVQPLKEVIA